MAGPTERFDAQSRSGRQAPWSALIGDTLGSWPIGESHRLKATLTTKPILFIEPFGAIDSCCVIVRIDDHTGFRFDGRLDGDANNQTGRGGPYVPH